MGENGIILGFFSHFSTLDNQKSYNLQLCVFQINLHALLELLNKYEPSQKSKKCCGKMSP